MSLESTQTINTCTYRRRCTERPQHQAESRRGRGAPAPVVWPLACLLGRPCVEHALRLCVKVRAHRLTRTQTQSLHLPPGHEPVDIERPHVLEPVAQLNSALVTWSCLDYMCYPALTFKCCLRQIRTEMPTCCDCSTLIIPSSHPPTVFGHGHDPRLLFVGQQLGVETHAYAAHRWTFAR